GGEIGEDGGNALRFVVRAVRRGRDDQVRAAAAQHGGDLVLALVGDARVVGMAWPPASRSALATVGFDEPAPPAMMRLPAMSLGVLYLSCAWLATSTLVPGVTPSVTTASKFRPA